MMSYADLILDQSASIVMRPLSLLATDVGVKSLVNTTNALSMQYEKCWVILYAQTENRSPCTSIHIILVLHVRTYNICVQ